MKIFHKEADYAVRTLIFLALCTKTEYISVTSLAEELGLPLNFLRRICSTLIKVDILAAKEGAGGGVLLEKDPKNISVWDIMSLFHEKLEISECTFRKKLCPNRSTCVLRKRILTIEEKIKQEFQAITIQDLINDIKQKPKNTSPPPFN